LEAQATELGLLLAGAALVHGLALTAAVGVQVKHVVGAVRARAVVALGGVARLAALVFADLTSWCHHCSRLRRILIGSSSAFRCFLSLAFLLLLRIVFI